MIELAKKNNPTANFKVMDCRQINNLDTKYDGIVCGFCLPYLAEADSSKLVFDCNRLLADNGILYLSFVEGDKNKSGFQVGSSGDRTYFHYYNINNLELLLFDNGFEKLKIFKVSYKKTDESSDEHTILLTKKKTTA